MAENLGTKNNQYGYYIYWKALALEKLKLYLESLETYQKVVISAIEPDFKGSIYGLPPFQVSDIISHDNLIDALLGKANVLASMAALPENKKQQIFLLEKSFEHYEKASEVVRNHNKQVNTENDKLQFASIKSPINDDVLQTALKLYYVTGKQYWLEKSFAAADHGKAGVVSSGMHDDACKRMGGVPDSLVQKGKNLQEEISLLQSSIREEINRQKPDSARIGKWRSKLLETMNSSGKNAKEMEEKYPHYYQLKYAGQKLNMNLLRGQTGFRKAMVEYVFTTDSLYTFVISDKTIHLTSRPKCGIEDSVMLFRKKLSYVDDFALKQIGIKNFVYQASWLYITLIKPIEPYIKGKELIIIPDGTLSLLPFEALVTSDSIPKQPDYGLLPYMLYKYTISYAYCAELFSMQQQMKPIVAEGLLAYAPEYKSFLYNRPENLSKTSTTIMLSPLRGSQEEIKNIAQTFGGKAISGKKATETIFKKHTSENKILHLAMHTIIDNEFPMYSKLVFSKSKDTTDDGFLNTYEVYNLNLKTPLIVLSACNTGYGKLMKGEGIISLARGFIYAGCPSMVITLWSIADRSSSNLMQLFYRNLDQKQNIDKSLQNAKIEYIKSSDQRLSHPYYWAGFIESGKTTPIVKMKISHWQKWLFIIPFGILIIAGVSIYMKKDKH
jgi:CHAT domain-containing protein